MHNPNEWLEGLSGCFRKGMGTSHEYESHIQNLFALASRSLDSFKPLNMLDVGCGDGSRTLRMAERFRIPLSHVYGLDCNPSCIDQCRNLFHAELVNLESGAIPYEDGTFDLIVCNQVLEHLKNYHGLLEQIIGVAKSGGHIIIGIPNLAHLINRFYLLFGIQPMCIDISSSHHVRAFTHDAFKQKLHSLPGITYVDCAGSELIYPLPLFLARPVSKICTGFCAYVCYLIRKQ